MWFGRHKATRPHSIKKRALLLKLAPYSVFQQTSPVKMVLFMVNSLKGKPAYRSIRGLSIRPVRPSLWRLMGLSLFTSSTCDLAAFLISLRCLSVITHGILQLRTQRKHASQQLLHAYTQTSTCFWGSRSYLMWARRCYFRNSWLYEETIPTAFVFPYFTWKLPF